MKNKRQIKIYGFDRNAISEGVICEEDLDSKVITLPDCFFVKAYEKYCDVELKNDDFIDGIIKIMLPKEEDEAKTEWMEGLKFQDKLYKGWIATTSGMKVETGNGICESIFVREDIYDFVKDFEKLISLGKFEEIEASEKEVCINKDILSRISLGLTEAQPAGLLPNIIVLPQATYRLVNDYKTVVKQTEETKNEEGENENTISYKLKDIHHDADIDVFDGGGIGTPKVFEQIQAELQLKYNVEFAIIRGYGIGIKGLVTRFDMLGYLDEFYDGDTDYCKKVDSTYFLIDYWNQWREVTDTTLLLNESMVKLAKYYNADKEENWDTYLSNMAAADEKYKDILGQLYVSKVNKSEEELSEYRRLNYQLLCALALSKKDFAELMKEDLTAYRKILRPFTKDAEKDVWDVNADYIRLFFKQVVNCPDDELEETATRKVSNVVTKCEELLNISEDFVKLKFVKRQLAGLIEKRCRELACGKITVKARYQYIGICPISYMNYAMTRGQGTNGLQTGEFYNYDVQSGEIRTIARNPLCAYSEVHNVSFVKSDVLDKYLSHCKELIFFNQQSDILALMSSADCDGDACTVIDNEIIKNAVVVPPDGRYFWNTDDGHKVTMIYNAENKFVATYRAAGNLIGRIALKSARVNGDSQLSKPYYDKEAGTFVGLSDISLEDEKEALLQGKNDEIHKRKQAIQQERVDSGQWISTWNVPEEHKTFMRKRFVNNELDIYTVLYNAMVSIDAPKTLYFPQEEDMQMIEDKYRKKAYFLMYREDAEDIDKSKYTKPIGVLDSASGYVQSVLLDTIDDNKKSFEDNVELLQKLLINGKYDVEKFEACQQEIAQLYSGYTSAREKVDREKSNEIKKLFRERYERIEAGCWDYDDDESLEYNKRQLRDAAYLKYKELDKEYVVKANAVLAEYSEYTVANAIGCMERCREDFIVNFFTPLLKVMNEIAHQKRYVFQKIAEPQDSDVRYLYEYYRKVEVEPISNVDIVADITREEKYRMKLTDLNHEFRARVLAPNAIETLQQILDTEGFMKCKIEVQDGKVFLLFEDTQIFEVFPDFYQIGKYTLLNASEIRIDAIRNIASTKKSLKMVTTSIIIHQ